MSASDQILITVSSNDGTLNDQELNINIDEYIQHFVESHVPSINNQNVIIYYHENIIDVNDTPELLQMENGDRIYVNSAEYDPQLVQESKSQHDPVPNPFQLQSKFNATFNYNPPNQAHTLTTNDKESFLHELLQNINDCKVVVLSMNVRNMKLMNIESCQSVKKALAKLKEIAEITDNIYGIDNDDDKAKIHFVIHIHSDYNDDSRTCKIIAMIGHIIIRKNTNLSHFGRELMMVHHPILEFITNLFGFCLILNYMVHTINPHHIFAQKFILFQLKYNEYDNRWGVVPYVNTNDKCTKFINDLLQMAATQNANRYRMNVGLIAGNLTLMDIYPLINKNDSNFELTRLELQKGMEFMLDAIRHGIIIPLDDTIQQYIIMICYQCGLYRIGQDFFKVFSMPLSTMSNILIAQEAMIALEQFEDVQYLHLSCTFIFYRLIWKDDESLNQLIFRLFLALYCLVESGMRKYQQYELFLGYLMIFERQLIMQYINNHSLSDLQQNLALIMAVVANQTPMRFIITTAKKIKNKRYSHFRTEGIRRFGAACAIIDRGPNHNESATVDLCRGHYEWSINADIGTAKMFFVLSIIKNGVHGSILCKVFGLISLIDIGYDCNEYMLVKKLASAVSKICHDYFLDDIIASRYLRHWPVRVLNQRITLICANCGRSESNVYIGYFRFRACSGCMNTFYCRRKCQKIHWITHRLYCIQQPWRYLYPALRQCIFAPLK